jgi:hypothetical protein
MTITNGYATLADFKAFETVRGETAATDTADDAVIETIIEAVSRHIDLATGRRFWKDATDTIAYYSAETPECVKIDDLSAAPTLVEVDWAGVRSYVAMSSADYELEPTNPPAGMVAWPYTSIWLAPQRTLFFPTWRRGVRVTGKFGFPAVPADIKEICEEISLNVYGGREGQASGAGNITITAGGVTIRPQDVPARAVKIFDFYRSPL